MASIEKYIDNGDSIRDIIGHVNRTLRFEQMSNQCIDFSKTKYDYHVGIVREDAYKYYQKLKKACFVYNRKDVKMMVGVIITLPPDVAPQNEKTFFEVCYNFVKENYFPENRIITAMVHVDEEQPHLHILACPITANTDKMGNNRYKEPPANGIDTRREIEKYKYKFSASDVLTRHDYLVFHDQLQDYLEKHGVEGKVKSGITRAQGGAMTVRELKRETLSERAEREKRIERNLQRSRCEERMKEARERERMW